MYSSQKELLLPGEHKTTTEDEVGLFDYNGEEDVAVEGEKTENKFDIKCFIRILKTFYILQSSWKSIVLTLILIGAGICRGFVQTYMFVQTADMPNLIISGNQKEFNSAVWTLFLLVLANFMLLAVDGFLGRLLPLVWYQMFSLKLLSKYLHSNKYYSLKLDGNIVNPDQRISSDLATLTQLFVQFFSPLLSMLLPAGMAAIQLSRTMMGVNGTLVIIAYSLIMNVISTLVLKFTVPINAQRERRSGFLRSVLTRTRICTESIAFYKGQDLELSKAQSYLRKFISAAFRVSMWSFVMNIILSLSGGRDWNPSMLLFGFQYYFNVFGGYQGTMTDKEWLEQLVAVKLNAGAILVNLGVLISTTSSISPLAASVNRIFELIENLDNITAQSSKFEDTPGSVSFDGVTFYTPDRSKKIVENLSFDVPEGKKLLITGSSGCGKTSVLRVIAGLWQADKGVVSRPAKIGPGGMMFIPQKPFMPHGSLKDIVTYPSASDDLPYSELHSLLSKVSLDYLLIQYPPHTVIEWENVLSVGEQQRISILRVLFNRPRVVILDECTSALNKQLRETVYELFQKINLTIISVGPMNLAPYHDNVLALISPTEFKYDATEKRVRHSYEFKQAITDEEEKEENLYLSEQNPSVDKDFEKAKKPLYTKKLFSYWWRVIKVMTASRRTKLMFLVCSVTAVLNQMTIMFALGLYSSLQGSVVSQGKFFTTVAMADGIMMVSAVLYAFLTVAGFIAQYMLLHGIIKCLQKHYYFKDNHYKISLNADLDNPDQRIAADTEALAGRMVTLYADILMTIGALLAAGLTTNFTSQYAILLGIRMALGLVGFLIVMITNVPISQYNYVASKTEGEIFHIQAYTVGDYRFGLARIKTHAESLAFYSAGNREHQLLKAQLKNSIRAKFIESVFVFVQSALKAAATAVANTFTIMSPAISTFWFHMPIENCNVSTKDCQKRIKETSTTMSSAIDTIGSLFGLLTNDFATFGEMAGNVNRIGELMSAMDEIESSEEVPDQGHFVGGSTVVFNQVAYGTPTGRQLMSNFSFSLPLGSSVLLMGPSGCGKSSLLRVLAGLWPLKEGIITKPLAVNKILFLPQRPYMIDGTLADQISFPVKLEFLDEEEKQIVFNKMAVLLRMVGLENLVSELGAVHNWSEILSVGEQQKVSFLRVFWNRPVVAILDEATSAMDEENERLLYTRLSEERIAFVSVGHKESLVDYHEWLVNFDGKGSFTASQTKLTPEPQPASLH